MSLDSVSRARAIFNGVMSKNSCRVVLIALLMLVCGSGSVFAQLADGDTITIRYNGSNNYLAVSNNNSLTYYSGDKPTVECLWIVTINGRNYSFESVSLENKNVTNRKLQGQDGTTLQLAGTGSTFGLGTDGDMTNVANQVTGRFYYYYTDNNRYRFIQYNDGWSLTDYRYRSGGSNKNPKYTNYDADDNPENTLLLLEKWTRKEVKGGLTGSFSPTEKIEFKNFDKTDAEARAHATSVNFTIKRTAATTYYQCVNRADAKIDIESNTHNTPIELSLLSVSWQSTSNSTTSKANCSNYEDAAVTSRSLLEYTRGEYTNNAQTITLPITITPVGSSPMEMKSADGTRWADHTDNLVVAFRDKADGNETTYSVSLPVTRYSYHKEDLPELEVSVDPASEVFSRDEDTRNFTFTCAHQHGVKIMHMYNKDEGGEGATEGLTSYVYEQEPIALSIIEDSDPLTATFALKNTNDETNVTWGITLGGITNNVLSLTAPTNTTSQVRTARLVGTFVYADGDDTHTKVIVVPISQNAKDGVKLHHQKGYYNTEFGKNKITGAPEQQVHTAEKTIYYLPNETIALVLSEPRFTAYQRWYDYETDGDPQWNFDVADRITWVKTPTGDGINPEIGNSYGIYETGSDAYDPESNGNVIPRFKAWNYNNANIQEAYHTLACDLSHYTDLSVSSTDITEPTLSYRQLWHFRPAKEMAAKLDTCTGDKYLETHYYTAPTSTNIFLATDYHHSLSKTIRINNQNVEIFATQNSYFYDANNPKRIAAGNLNWYQEDDTVALTKNYTAKDFQTVSSTTVGTITYYLRASVGGKTLNIAKFVVNYVDKSKHGPTTTQIISRDTIVNKYDVLAEIDFNYEGVKYTDNGTYSDRENSSENTQVYHPLPWLQSSYGYYYPNDCGLANDNHSNRNTANIPYYGEYALLNYMNASWATGTARGGKATDFSLFVDGTTEPGLVASISTDAVVCSGQTMYCSMWLLNPRKSGQTTGASNPIFRCNIQGRNSGDTEWHDVGTYFVGEVVGGGQPWHQVVFPIESEISYDETRVQIYNFGEGGNGNDFMVDDICLYASPLPLATYHQTTGCTSYADDETTSTLVVLRIDYSQLQFEENAAIRNVYYQIVDVTDTDSVILKLKDADDNSLYYHEGNTSDTTTMYGYISIPKTVDMSIKKDNVDAYIEELTELGQTTTSGKCFVQDPITKKWYLYLVQMIPNGDGGDRDKYLDRDRQYILRVSYDADELVEADCVFTSEVLAKQDTYLQLRNEKLDSLRIPSCYDGVCANDHHFLDLKVSNAISPTIGGTMETYEALVHADWLRGFEDDDVYCDEKTITVLQKDTADTRFLSNYGHTRAEVKSAIVAMRRVPSSTYPNPNYMVADPEQLQEVGDFGADDLALIRDLCNKGLLQLYKKTIMFYLGSEASARYWVYPVAENATVMVNGDPVPLQDCDEPKWVKITSAYSEYGVNLSPIHFDKQTQHQRLDVPTIRVPEGTDSITIPIKHLLGNTTLNSTLHVIEDSIITFNFKESHHQVLEYVDLSNHRINIVDAPTQLELGVEYLMRMAFYDNVGNVYIAGDTTECRVGYVYFYIMAVPNRMEWTGAKSDVWGDDRNWSGGRAPLSSSDVIIPAGLARYPVVGTTDLYPMDVNYHPNVCNDIYFAPGATIGNQHLLEYRRAFVDMEIEPANWNSMAPPLKGMYTGDMFVPHTGYDGLGISNLEYKSTDEHSQYPFVVNSFQGTRTSKAPYMFWQSLYNKRATIYHENGNQSHPALTTTAIFAQTNSLGQPLPPGTGYQVLGFGPNQDESDEIIVRLPKPDTYYRYFYKDGTVSDQQVSVSHSSKLAFEPDANGDMYITLTNDLPSKQFMFGNPAMTNINMQKFLADNAQLAKKYYTMSNSSWKAETWTTVEKPGSGELAPMRSVLLELASGEATSITVKLSKTHLVGYTEPAPAGLVARKNVAEEELGETQLMTIYATSEGGQARCMLASNAYAHDIYDNQEDALFISSGVEEGVNSATATSPVNMYTVSEQVPMMVDVRENIDTVPLSMLVHKSYRTEKVKFSFYLSLNWDKECYFCDAVTGERYRILDGLVLEMDMPQNHEVRYFIDGPDVIDPDNGGDIWSSTEDVKTSANQVWAYSPSQGQLVVASNDIIKAVTVYDIAGRLIGYRELEMQYNSTTFDTPTGACIVKAVLRDNTEHYISALVK